MAKNRGIDWGRFIDTEVRSYGTDNPKDTTTRKRLQFAYRIDTSLVTPLSVLPASVASDEPMSLPQRNLIRSFELGLPNGQAVARAMGVPVLQDDQIKIGDPGSFLKLEPDWQPPSGAGFRLKDFVKYALGR